MTPLPGTAIVNWEEGPGSLQATESPAAQPSLLKGTFGAKQEPSHIRSVSEPENYQIGKEVLGPRLGLFINIFLRFMTFLCTRSALVFFLGHVRRFFSFSLSPSLSL